MKYTNLDIIIDASKDNEIRYNFESGRATVYAKTEADAQRGVEALQKRDLLPMPMQMPIE
jgi:hypothetical protein